jgi:hypothetical protein
MNTTGLFLLLLLLLEPGPESGLFGKMVHGLFIAIICIGFFK